MPKRNQVVETLNTWTWKSGKRLALAAEEANLSTDDLGELIRDTMVAVRKRMNNNMKPKTNAEWATRVCERIDGLEGKISAQTVQLTAMLEALNQFIEMCHPGRFGERLRVVGNSEEKMVDTVHPT